MVFSVSAASQEKLSADLEKPHPPGESLKGSSVARPLVPVTLALMAGIAAPAWGLHLPEPWLLAGGAALWARPGPVLAATPSGPLSALDLLRPPGGGFPSTGPAAGFSSRAPRQTAPAPEPDPLRPSEPSRQAGGGTGPALHGGRCLAESLGLAAGRRQPPGAGPGAGTPAGGRPAWWSGGAWPRPDILQNPGTFNRPRFLAADGLFREIRLWDPHRPDLPGRHRCLSLGREAPGRHQGAVARAWTRPAGPSICPCCWGTRARSPRRCATIWPAPAPATCWSSTACTWGWWPRSSTFSASGSCGAFPGCCLRVNVVKIATLLAAIAVVFYAWVAGGLALHPAGRGHGPGLPPAGLPGPAPGRSGAPWPWRPSSS